MVIGYDTGYMFTSTLIDLIAILAKTDIHVYRPESHTDIGPVRSQ